MRRFASEETAVFFNPLHFISHTLCLSPSSTYRLSAQQTVALKREALSAQQENERLLRDRRVRDNLERHQQGSGRAEGELDSMVQGGFPEDYTPRAPNSQVGWAARQHDEWAEQRAAEEVVVGERRTGVITTDCCWRGVVEKGFMFIL